jgi:hypothetical protein
MTGRQHDSLGRRPSATEAVLTIGTAVRTPLDEWYHPRGQLMLVCLTAPHDVVAGAASEKTCATIGHGCSEKSPNSFFFQNTSGVQHSVGAACRRYAGGFERPELKHSPPAAPPSNRPRSPRNHSVDSFFTIQTDHAY